MEWDIFFAISQTPAGGMSPDETEMFESFFEQVEAADRLGFGVAWIAESHLSSEVQKLNAHPVIPHWQGEVGLNVDFLQLSHHIFRRTQRIETGSAVMNILCNGGPIAAAERIAAFSALHGLDAAERRRIHVGFAAGRFDFMNRASGIVPRDPVEEAAWPALKGKIFAEASEIFLRLLRGEVLRSEQVRSTTLCRADFRSDEDWDRVLEAAGRTREPAGEVTLEIARRWTFEDIKIVPQEWRRELVQLVIGSHDPHLQEEVNRYLPVQVFNLSITQPEIIEETHQRMSVAYHTDGGMWHRGYMPRTTFVFLNEQPGLSPEDRREAAQEEAREALGAYWTALEGTLDPQKVENAAENALVGNAQDVANQILRRFHKDDRLMLWFDFFNHDCDRVISNMEDFMGKVRPLVEQGLSR
jgi:alkanesulfonate monooxygenase SsuD/methylene tetrahydromethanopterin reductase-like flavin-dependent oxidoreductase (luciferase family)